MNALGYPLHEAMSDARDWLSGTTFYEGMRGWKPCMAVLVAEIERFADECSVSIRDSTAGNVRTHSAAEWIGMSQENERLRALLEISERMALSKWPGEPPHCPSCGCGIDAALAMVEIGEEKNDEASRRGVAQRGDGGDARQLVPGAASAFEPQQAPASVQSGPSFFNELD